jgi:hypothetical protein
LDGLLLDGRGRGFGGVVVDGCAGAGWSGTAAASGEDELGRGGGVAFEEEDVGSGAVKERGEDRRGGGGAVVAEDALIGDAAGDFETGLAGDGAEDLVEAGVVGAHVQLAIEIGDGGAPGSAAGWGVAERCGGHGGGQSVGGGRWCGGRGWWVFRQSGRLGGREPGEAAHARAGVKGGMGTREILGAKAWGREDCSGDERGGGKPAAALLAD